MSASNKWKLCVSNKWRILDSGGRCMLRTNITVHTIRTDTVMSCAYAVNIHGLVDAEIMIKTASLMLTTAHVLDGVAAPPYCMCTNAICILQFHMSNDAN